MNKESKSSAKRRASVRYCVERPKRRDCCWLEKPRPPVCWQFS